MLVFDGRLIKLLTELFPFLIFTFSLYLNGIFAIEDEDVYLEISRVKLEELLLGPLEKAVDIVNRLLRKLNYTVEQINEVASFVLSKFIDSI